MKIYANKFEYLLNDDIGLPVAYLLVLFSFKEIDHFTSVFLISHYIRFPVMRFYTLPVRVSLYKIRKALSRIPRDLKAVSIIKTILSKSNVT